MPEIIDVIARLDLEVTANPVREIVNDLTRYVGLSDRVSKTSKDINQQKVLEQKIQQNLNKEIERSEKLRIREEKQLQAVTNDYKLLNAALNDQIGKFRQYALALGANHPITVQAQQDALRMQAALKGLDFAVGNFQRNVGHYNAVGAQFNQLLRELPNLAISPRTFLISLSNNFGYFAEEVVKARRAGASFADIMKKDIGGALFGLTGAVNIAILALGLLPQIFEKIQGEAKKTKDTFDELVKSLGSSAIQAQENINKQTIELRTLIAVIKDENASTETKQKALDKLNQTYPNYLKNVTAEAVAQGKANDALANVENAIQAKEKANLAQEDAVKLQTSENKLLRERDDLLKKVTTAQTNLANAQRIAASGGAGERAGTGGAVAGAELALSNAQTALNTKTAELRAVQDGLDFARTQAIRQTIEGADLILQATKGAKDPYKAALDEANRINEEQKLLDESLGNIIIKEIELNDKYVDLYRNDIISNRAISEDERVLREEGYKEEQQRLEILQESRLNDLNMSLLRQKAIIAEAFNKAKDVAKFENELRDLALEQAELQKRLLENTDVMGFLGTSRSRADVFLGIGQRRFRQRPLGDVPEPITRRSQLGRDLFGVGTFESEQEKLRDSVLKTADAYQTLATSAIQAYQVILQGQQAALQREIQYRTEAVRQAERLAERGNTEVLRQETERLEESQRKQEDFAQTQLALNAALTVSNSIAAIARVAAETGTGLVVAVPIALATLIASFAAIAQAARGATGFAEGVVNLQGEGTGTSDSIPARLSKGESVVTAKATSNGDNAAMLSMMNAGHAFRFADTPMMNNSYATTLQTKALEKEVRLMRSAIEGGVVKQNFNMNERGFGFYQERVQKKTKDWYKH